jgi:hypothetical protein
MERKAKVGLETAVADLQELSRRLERMLLEIEDGPAREDLEQIRLQAKTAIEYYRSLVPPQRQKPVPEVLQRVAQAAVVPTGGVGLQVFGFSLSPDGQSK